MLRRAALAAVVAAAIVAAPATAVDLVKKPSSLTSVPARYQPKWRWWWPFAAVDAKEVDAELRAMKAAGFSGVEQVLLRRPNDWWTEEFRASTKHAIETATSLGMTFDTTLGPMWPIASKAVDDVSKGLSMQEAAFSAMDVLGPSTYTGPVPSATDGGGRPQTLIAATAAQVVSDGAPTVLDPKTAVDLTPKVTNGTLTWEVPAGRWKLVGTWMRPTGQRAHGDLYTLAAAMANSNLPVIVPDADEQLGPLVPDHFSRAAIDATLKDYDDTLFGDDMAAVLRRNGGHVFEDSLELNHVTASSALPDEQDGCIACNGRFWTPAFLTEFKQRRGYDLTPLLPAIFGSFDLPDGGGLRLKHDYFETLADLLVDNHYAPIRAWANAHGLKQRAQGYKLQGSDKTRVSARIELPDTESLDDGETGDNVAPGTAAANQIIDDYRQVVSGAHLSGAKELTLEAGANLGGEFDMSVDDYKVIADRAYAAGITTMALHGFAYRLHQDPYQSWSWPGWAAFGQLFAESWSQSYPAMAQWGGLARYYGRISAVLQSGRPRVDVTVLSTPANSHLYGAKETADALRGANYTWDRLDDASLRDLPQPQSGRILRRGPAYRALVLDGVASISQVAAEKALAVARTGVPVVVAGDVPAHGVSYRDASAEDAAVKAAFDALLALPNVRLAKPGKPAIAALRGLGVTPDFRGAASVVPQHRRTATGHVWFLYNNSGKRLNRNVTFAATGRPLQIDPWTGKATQLGAYRARRGATTLPLDLAAGETAIVAFRPAQPRLHATSAQGDVLRRGRTLVVRDTRDGKHRARLSNGRRADFTFPDLPEPITARGPWKLGVKTVGPDGDGEVDLQLDELADWRDIPELAGASGTGTYRTTLTVPGGWMSRTRGVLLDTGAVGGFLELAINGRTVPFPSLASQPRDISRFLHPGDNTLIAKVATTVTNVVVAHARSGDPRYAEFAIVSPQAYGLIGPVRLVPFAQRTLARLPAH
jgi:hypothetical protein